MNIRRVAIAIALLAGVLLSARQARADDLRLEEVLSSIDQTFQIEHETHLDWRLSCRNN